MVFVRSIKVTPVSSNFLLKELDLSPHRQVAGFFLPFRPAIFADLPAKPHSTVSITSIHAALQND
jgi:hypothetical protein